MTVNANVIQNEFLIICRNDKCKHCVDKHCVMTKELRLHINTYGFLDCNRYERRYESIVRKSKRPRKTQV